MVERIKNILYNLAIRAQMIEYNEGYMNIIGDYVALVQEIMMIDEPTIRAINVAAEALVAQIKEDKEKSEQP